MTPAIVVEVARELTRGAVAWLGRCPPAPACPAAPRCPDLVGPAHPQVAACPPCPGAPPAPSPGPGREAWLLAVALLGSLVIFAFCLGRLAPVERSPRRSGALYKIGPP